MSKIFVFLFILSGCLLDYVTLEVETSIPSIVKYFNTKGRYEDVNLYLRDDVLAVNSSVLQTQCEPIHLTAIIRHGTRYPTTKKIKEMKQLYRIILHSNATEDHDWLREIQTQWKMWYTEDMDGRLVQKGVDDLKHLAVRFSKMFPSLISEENLRGGLFQFTTSSKHRCVNSTMSFKAGLTELWNIKDLEIPHTVNDTLMRFFHECDRLKQEVDNNSSAVREVDQFKNGPEMKRVYQRITDLLGVPHSLITHDLAEAAFDLCGYEFTIKEVNSPWCQLFTEEDAKVMEYASDLREFWKRGYGHEINSRASCVLLRDVFERLDREAIRSKHDQKSIQTTATVQVGHADTLLPLLTLLGFFKDTEALTSVNYASQANRAFRTSHMMPYAANFLFVLYKCGRDDLRLQILLNEKPVTLPGSTNQQDTMPLYEDFKELCKDLLQGCDFKTECQL
ncbi:multiple inositol polyphosphate phosphatase 1-like [Gouania willdenowi]|uniref:Multiple inositol polyphosphate phosphatase 1 n=1 Tax=Gouania willdenowi TaxID=441366 RepID=A0A8C5I2E7_GOUWI|nr:multiple inositol polyphosphate phosphatase 1-like [Gouania willdenowi]